MTHPISQTPSEGGIMLGLILLTVPAVFYSLTQMWHLFSGGALDHAVRAFLP